MRYGGMGMKMYRFPETKAWKAAFCSYLFAMLLFSRDTMIADHFLGIANAQFLNLGLLLSGGIVFLLVNRNGLKNICMDARVTMIAVSGVILLTPMLIKQDWQLMYFSVAMCVVFSVFLSNFVLIEETAKVYIWIMMGLSLYSLIANYILKPLALDGVLQIPVFVNRAGIEHYNFGLCFEREWSWYNRNYGLFREPGVYQYFLLLALLLNNYCVQWRSTKSLWIINAVFFVTMLSTYATGGVIELVLFFAVLLLDKEYYKYRPIRRMTIIAVIAMAGVIIISIITENNVYFLLKDMVKKLFNFSVSSSGGVRYHAILLDAKFFFNKPLFGEKLTTVINAISHNTTSTMLMFAVFGVFGGLFHVAGWVALVWDKRRKNWVNLALLLIMFMSFNTQNLIADVFFWLFPMMALVEKGLPLLKLGERKKAA